MSKGLLFAAYVITSVVGLAVLRRTLPRISFHAPGAKPVAALVLGVALYALSFALWLLILRMTPLVIAYPTAVGLTICGSAIAAYFFLGEHLRPSQAGGMALIIAGIFFVIRR